jgi:hypothetical protein
MFSLIVDNTTLYSNGSYVTSLPWLTLYSDYFCFASITSSNYGTHSFQFSLIWKDDLNFIQVFTYSFDVIVACQVTSATVVSAMVSSIATQSTLQAKQLTSPRIHNRFRVVVLPLYQLPIAAHHPESTHLQVL